MAPAELVAGVELLVAKLGRYQPRIACFHGVTGYRPVHRVLTGDRGAIRLGPQDVRVGATRLYLVPNRSGANAHYTPAEQTRWYHRLADALTHLPATNSPAPTTLQSATMG